MMRLKLALAYLRERLKRRLDPGNLTRTQTIAPVDQYACVRSRDLFRDCAGDGIL